MTNGQKVGAVDCPPQNPIDGVPEIGLSLHHGTPATLPCGIAHVVGANGRMLLELSIFERAGVLSDPVRNGFAFFDTWIGHESVLLVCKPDF